MATAIHLRNTTVARAHAEISRKQVFLVLNDTLECLLLLKHVVYLGSNIFQIQYRGGTRGRGLGGYNPRRHLLVSRRKVKIYFLEIFTILGLLKVLLLHYFDLVYAHICKWKACDRVTL